MEFEIGGRPIGDHRPVYVVAEAGSNHNGDREQAFRLIDLAAEAAADAVKFQLFTARRMYPRSAGQSAYLNVPRSIYEIIESMEMPRAWIPQLAEHCADRGIDFLCTPFDEESADVLEPYVPAFKIASYEMTHTPLVAHVARFGKPVFMSTGAANLAEAIEATNVIRSTGNDRIVLLQCTAKYPAPIEALNLAAMTELRAATGQLVGFSDHSRDPVVGPIAATALGAVVIEKHFTLSNGLPGPDHRFAVEPDELSRMVQGIRGAERALGTGRKQVLDVEAELHAFARRSIFSTRDIAAGEPLTVDNVAVLRCGSRGYGLRPSQYPSILGRTAVRAIPQDAPIEESCLK